MYMPVIKFLARGRSDVYNFDIERQGFARKRMVAVDCDVIAIDCNYCDDTWA